MTIRINETGNSPDLVQTRLPTETRIVTVLTKADVAYISDLVCAVVGMDEGGRTAFFYETYLPL